MSTIDRSRRRRIAGAGPSRGGRGVPAVRPVALGRTGSSSRSRPSATPRRTPATGVLVHEGVRGRCHVGAHRRRARRVSKPGRRVRARVRHQRQGRHHRRAGHAPHLRFPPRSARPPPSGTPRDGREVRPVAAELGARHAYEYHPTSAHWVLSASSSGSPARTSATSSRTASPSRPACPGSSASSRGPTHRQVVNVGEPASPEEIQAAFGSRAARHRGDTRGPARLQRAGGPRRSACPAAAPSCGRPRALLPGAAAQPGRDVEAGRAGRRHRQRPQPAARSDDRHTANRTLGLILAGDDGTLTPGPRAHGVAAGVRPQRRRGSAGVGRSRHRPLARLLHERARPHVVREPRRGTAMGGLAAVCTTG